MVLFYRKKGGDLRLPLFLLLEPVYTWPVHIRKGNTEDIPFIKAGLIDSWVMHARQVPELFDEERMRSSPIEEYYQKCFASPDCFVFIAEEDSKPVGFVRADLQEIQNFFRDPHILYIDDIFVLEEYRKKGIAQALLMEVEKLAKEKGIKRLQCRIYSFNIQRNSCLRHLGIRSHLLHGISH